MIMSGNRCVSQNIFIYNSDFGGGFLKHPHLVYCGSLPGTSNQQQNWQNIQINIIFQLVYFISHSLNNKYIYTAITPIKTASKLINFNVLYPV